MPERYYALVSTRWADRLFRAMSGGEVTEPALLFSRCHQNGGTGDDLVEDDIAQAAEEAAARIAAGDEVVTLPLHGRVRRVELPGFTLQAWEKNPLTATAGERPTVPVAIPPELVYVPVADAP